MYAYHTQPDDHAPLHTYGIFVVIVHARIEAELCAYNIADGNFCLADIGEVVSSPHQWAGGGASTAHAHAGMLPSPPELDRRCVASPLATLLPLCRPYRRILLRCIITRLNYHATNLWTVCFA